MNVGDQTPILIAIVVGIWVLFIGLFIIPVVRLRQRRRRTITWLQKHGWRISVTVDRVETQGFAPPGTAGALLTRHVLIARAWDAPSGSRYLFRSETLRGTIAEDLPGATVDVLVDPDDPNRYWMDATTLR